ncbi:unnamed protein product [Protopolystoma xenopodis]|uniref:Cadherin domain-containing protein n=1 Tax=Protopolystoma xenopodis TaxID=117903 RepID=A0A448WRS2_9PLAT|nr:unnamed protein product [Protopolystoma xenopodis]
MHLTRPLDYELSTSHHFLIEAMITENDIPLLLYISLLVYVDDVNEHAPQFLGMPTASFSQSSLQYFGSEESDIIGGEASVPFIFIALPSYSSETLLGRVTAFDLDSNENGRISYRIIGGPKIIFIHYLLTYRKKS